MKTLPRNLAIAFAGTAILINGSALAGMAILTNGSAFAGQYPVAPPWTSVALEPGDFIQDVPQQSSGLSSPNRVIGDQIAQHPGAFDIGWPEPGTFFVGVFGHPIATNDPNAGVYLWETTSHGWSGTPGPQIQVGLWDGNSFIAFGNARAASYWDTGVSSDGMEINSSFTSMSDFGLLGSPFFLNSVRIEATASGHNQVTAVATGVPEPSPLSLVLLVLLGPGVLGFLRHRRQRHEPA